MYNYQKKLNRKGKPKLEKLPSSVYFVKIKCKNCGEYRYVRPQNRKQVTRCRLCQRKSRNH